METSHIYFEYCKPIKNSFFSILAISRYENDGFLKIEVEIDWFYAYDHIYIYGIYLLNFDVIDKNSKLLKYKKY